MNLKPQPPTQDSVLQPKTCNHAFNVPVLANKCTSACSLSPPSIAPRYRADGINFHGGHHNVLIEQCEMNYAGDDAYGLWPVSTDAVANPEVNCQRNIVLRNNVARWPRQVQTARSVAGGKGPLAYPDCDCAHYPAGTTCYSKPCYATYAGGAGVQWVNNRCEGSVRPINFNPGYESYEPARNTGNPPSPCRESARGH